MPTYSVDIPGKGTFDVESPVPLTDIQAYRAVQRQLSLESTPTFEPTPVAPPPPEGGFFPAVKRGALQTGMLLGDILPAMVGRAVGADEYAERQLQEAAETQARIQREAPAAVPSFTDISGVGDAWMYAKEAVGETLISIVPSLLTGGVAGILARPAVAAATQAAKETAERTLMNAALQAGPVKQEVIEKVKKEAIAEGIKAAQKTALRYEVTGAFAGSAAQNIPEVYQNILEETGKESIPAALLAGGFNAALDSILPVALLRKARASGVPEEELMGAWYKRGAKGLGKGFLVEGGTEAAQETSSIAAENFIAENSDFFTSKNLERVINAGIKGGLGGGVITGATDIALGSAPPPEVSDRQRAEQLQREILGDIQTARADQLLAEEEEAARLKAEAERPPTVDEIVSLASKPNGYGELEAVKQRLLGQTRTDETREAISVIKELQDRMVIEEQQRRAPAPPRIPTADDLINLAQMPDGYGQLEIERQNLLKLPKTPEVKEALEGIKDFQSRIISEQLQRTREPIKIELDDPTIRSLGFAKSENPNSVYQQLIGKSVADPMVTGFLENYANTKAKPQTKERIDRFLGQVQRYQIPLTAKEVAEGEANVAGLVGTTGGAGAPVVSQPGAGAPAPGPVGAQPSGVVPPVPPIERPVGGEAAAPVAVTPPIAPPPIEPPAPPVTPPVAAPEPAAVAAPVGAAPVTEAEAVQQHAVQGLPIVEAPLEQITLSQDVPQFKSDADKTGVVKALEGKFERTGVAPIQLWRRTDGRLEVISGRHRFDLAKRSGETTIPAQVHDEAAGFDAKQAATLDAELNIRDEQGEVKDYVVYFEKSGITEAEAKSRGLLGRPIGQRGWTIASQGSPELIAAHRSGIIPDDAAAGIAAAAPNDTRLQAAGIRAAQQGKNTATVVNTVQAVKALAKDRNITQEEAGDLFGFDDSAIREAEEMARVATQKQQELTSRLAAITGAAKKPEVAAKEGINIRDPEALNKRVQELRQQKAAWNNWSSSPALIKEIKEAISGEPLAKPSLTEEPKAPKPLKLSKETEAKIEELGKIMQRIMGKFGLKDVALNIERDLKQNGEYANRLIKLALDADSPVRDLRHESLHAMKELGFFSDAQWKTLEKMARDKWVDKYLKSRPSSYEGQPMSRYDAYMRLYNGSEEAVLEEAIADAFADFDTTKPPAGLMQTLLRRMRDLFRGIKESMGLANIDNAEDIFRRVEKGELRETAPAAPAQAKPSVRQERYSLRDRLGLYSELENKIEQAQIKAAPAAQWKTMINALVQKGVKPDEIQWSGVNDWLDLRATPQPVYESGYGLIEEQKNEAGVWQQVDDLGDYFRTKEEAEAAITKEMRAAAERFGRESDTEGRVAVKRIERESLNFGKTITSKVTKDEILSYLKQGGVKVEETVIGEVSPELRDLRKRISALRDKLIAAKEEFQNSGYLYREISGNKMLNALPEKWQFRYDKISRMQEEYDKLLNEEYNSPAAVPTKYGQYTLPGGENYREVLLRLPSDTAAEDRGTAYYRETTRDYKSSHWDQPNVLAHIRLNDRIDADGNKVLFVEEIQSDWGQEGKKKGFGAGDWEAPYRDWERGLRERAKTFYLDASDTPEEQATARRMGEKLAAREDLGSIATVMGERQQMAEAWDKAVALRGRVPAAPFVTKTEGWLNLALKRIMVMAAEGGYDKVAFVNGEQSADRYDLSKQIEEISYRKNRDGTYTLTATDKNGRVAMDKKSVNEADIEEIVGKEIAQKIVAGEGKPYPAGSVSEGMKELSGLDLKVGGEGMKTFYDTIVPTALKKLLPKVGGGQMGLVDIGPIDTGRGRQDEALLAELMRPAGQPGFDVTPAMQDKVQTTGLPRFSLRDVGPRQNLRDQLDPATRARMDQTIATREEKTFGQRMMEAISPKSYSFFRTQFVNRYDGLSKLDKMKVDMMGGVDILADAGAESAALLSDLGAGVAASAMGVNDGKGGVPVYKHYFVVEVNNRALAKQYTSRSQAEADAKKVNGVVRERGFTTVVNFDNTIQGPVGIFAPLMSKYKDMEIFRMFQFYSAVKRGARFMYTLDPNGNVVEKLFEPADIQKANDLEKQYPELKEVHANWIKYNDKLVDFMRDTGVISKEGAEVFKMHGDYFPFYRQIDEADDAVGPRIFQSIAAVKAPKKLKGGEARLGDFFENMVRNTQSAIQAGMKNVAARRAAELGQDVGIVFPVGPGQPTSGPEIFYVLENGQRRFFATTDQLMMNSIKSLNLPDMPGIGILAGPANLLRNLVTKDPGFILANLMRDSMSAWVTSGVKMTPIADTVANFGKALFTDSAEYKALQAAGVVGGYEFSHNVETSAKKFGGAIRKAAGVPTMTQQIARPVTSVWEALEKATGASDAATRMEVYKKTLAETGSEAEAVFRAMEVMNFNRKGSSAIIRILTAAVPFLNARIQGLDILYRAGIAPSFDASASDRAKQIQKTFFIRGATMMALSAMYWAMTHDDEEYKKQEQETRDNYWLLPSLGIKIPIPFEIGVLFKVIPERILGYTMGDDTGKDFLKSMGRQILSTFAFNPIPQAFIPIVETVTDFSFFTWRPILPQGMENVAPAYQVGPGTSKLAEGIGKTIGASPIRIDQLINGYTGTMGMYAVDLIDAIYNTMSDSPKASKRFEQLPVIRRFAVDPEARGTVTAYYDLKNAVDQVVRTSNLLEKTMDYEGYGQYMQENMKILASRDYVLDMEKTLKEFREMKTTIRSSNLSADAKRDYLTTIGQMENAMTANIQELKKMYQ